MATWIAADSRPVVTDSTNDVVVIRQLVKHYRHVRAVDGIDLTVKRGEIFGLLGRNGAGKTTTLRAILGLCRPTSGTITVHGSHPGTFAALHQTGALIENPTFYPYLSGRDNLRVVARMRALSDATVEDALAKVGLVDRDSTRFSQYSLGMKQRLGVAAALLGDPLLLVLDEPMNGLDPAGTADMRRLMTTVRERGRTVILSSHLLGEVEQVCDRVGVIEQGHLIATGTVADLGSRLSGATIVISATPRDQALVTLEANDLVHSVVVENGHLRIQTRSDPNEFTVGQLNRALVLAGIVVHDLRLDRPNLEQIYLTLTSNGSA